MHNKILEILNAEKCPICGAKIKMRCKCFMADSTCENGHKFHYSITDDALHMGFGNHGSGDCCKR